MKKHAYILICITLLCVVCVAAAHVTLLGTADEAEFDLTVYAGDPSAAEGITLTMRQSSLHQLFWDTTLRLTDPENPETQFTAESVPERAESVKYPPSGLRMILPSVSHRYDLGSISFDAKEWRKQLEDSGSGLSTEMMIQIDALGDRMGEPFTNWETEENRFLSERKPQCSGYLLCDLWI